MQNIFVLFGICEYDSLLKNPGRKNLSVISVEVFIHNVYLALK